MRPRSSIVVRKLVFAVLPSVAAAAQAAELDDVAAARQTLAAKGLTRVGDLWLTATEVQLRRRLESLDRLETQCRNAQEQVDKRVSDNEAVARNIAKKKDELEATRKRLEDPEVTGSERKQAEETFKTQLKQLTRLKAQYRNSAQLPEEPEVRQDVIRLVNARAYLALALATARREIAELPAEYRRLGADGAVRAAVAQAGELSRLGPARDYSPEEARLARLKKIVAADRVPVYREEQHFRVGTLVNERTAATWSVRQSNGPTLVPYSVAQSAGIAPAPDAAVVVYDAGNGRRLDVRPVTIGRIDLGSATLRNVKGYLLPPEGEDLGARLGRDAYADYYFDIDGLRLQLVVMGARKSATSAVPKSAR